VKLRWLILVLLMAPGPAFAADQSAISPNQRIIQMEGHSEVRAVPDQASMSFAIETKGSTAKQAAAQNAQIVQKVIDALRAMVGPKGKVETGGYALIPLYGSSGQSEDRIRDWVADNMVSVECDPSVAGSVLDAAHAAGALGSSSIDDASRKATMDLHIRTAALTASEAIKSSAEKAKSVNDAIQEKLASKGSSKIVPGNVQPEHEGGGDRQSVIGYQVSSFISVQTGAIDQLGSMIDAAIAAGANSANSVSFNLRNDASARSQAMAAACRDAQIKADAAAQALGLKVKRVMRITSVGDLRAQQGAYSSTIVGSSAVAATAIKPGEISVPATVTVTYELE
jgi:uncharacterized protein YggE